MDQCTTKLPVMKACEWFPANPLLKQDDEKYRKEGKCKDRETCLKDMLVKVSGVARVGPYRFGIWVEMAPKINKRIIVHIQNMCIYNSGADKKKDEECDVDFMTLHELMTGEAPEEDDENM